MFNRVNKILIGDGVNSAAASALTLANIAAGDLALVKADMTVVATNAAAAALSKVDPVYIAMGTGAGQYILSGAIFPKYVTKFSGNAYATPAEQISYIGFNGTTGTITPNNSIEYVLRIVIKDDLRVQPHRQTRGSYNYVTDTTATALELITGVLNRQAKDASSYVIAEMVTDGTFAVLGGSSTLAVTKGSKTATASSSSHGLVAGSLVRIGGTGATVPVYIVDSVATTTIKFKSVYKQATATIANASVGALTSTANYGIKLTGKSIASNGLDYYQKVSFDASLAPINGDINDAIVYTLDTKKAMGSGFWQQIRDMEYKAQGYLGVTNRTMFPSDDLQYPSMYQYVNGSTYHLICIEHFMKSGAPLQDTMESPLETVIAIPSGNGGTTNAQVVNSTAENFAYILSGLMVTNLGAGAALPSMS